MTYAKGTAVDVGKTLGEIERMLLRYGADEFGYVTRRTEAMIGFAYQSLRVELTVPIPDRDTEKFHLTATGRERSKHAAFKEWEKESRRRWRSLALVVKALLVGVQDGVLTFEEAFLSYIVWGDGATTSQVLLPILEQAKELGRMPGSLKALPARGGIR